MTRILSRELGEISVSEETVVHIPGGIAGFEQHESFFVHAPDDCLPFFWLISRRDPNLHFAVVDPSPYLAQPYEVSLTDTDRYILQLGPSDPMEIYTIVSPGIGEEGLTLNLKGPLAYNPKARTARQLVVFSSWPSIHHPMTPPTTSRQTGRKAMPAERRGGDRRAA